MKEGKKGARSALAGNPNIDKVEDEIEVLISYGRDLWDSLSLLTENTLQRTHQMKGLKTFFASYKKSLDSFSSALSRATSQYEKDFINSKDG